MFIGLLESTGSVFHRLFDSAGCVLLCLFETNFEAVFNPIFLELCNVLSSFVFIGEEDALCCIESVTLSWLSVPEFILPGRLNHLIRSVSLNSQSFKVSLALKQFEFFLLFESEFSFWDLSLFIYAIGVHLGNLLLFLLSLHFGQLSCSDLIHVLFLSFLCGQLDLNFMHL